MTLEKTLYNLRLTKDSFFNLEKGSEVWFELLKQNLYVLKNGGVNKHYLKNFFCGGTWSKSFKSLKNYDGVIFSIVLYKGNFAQNCFLVNGKDKKDI
jgi:hypothetical protein